MQHIVKSTENLHRRKINVTSMNKIKKTDYLKFVLHKAKIDLTRYNISNSDKELIDKLFGRLISSDNLLRDFFILSHVNELKGIGKYFIFILKKIEDNVINFENLSQNIDTDTEYLENELLNYLSNPKLRESRKFSDTEGASRIPDNNFVEENEKSEEEIIIEEMYSVNKESSEAEEEPEVSTFKKNYLELIQSETEEEEVVYELPKMDKEQPEENFYILPTSEELYNDKPDTKPIIQSEEKNIVNEDDGEIEIVDKDQTKTDTDEVNHKIPEVTLFENPEETVGGEEDQITETPSEKIQLSEEISEELNLFEKDQENIDGYEIELEVEREEAEQQPTNAAFLEYETEIKEKNNQLDKELDIMIYLVNAKPGDEDERNSIIMNIIEISFHLESNSRKMSLEIISNIYQTIMLSFEKISEGKYDMAENTLNLFKKGLSLVISLIKGDDYFGYKDILKSIENIRNALIEEKEKRKLYLKQLKEKQELENQLHKKYPDDTQKVKLGMIRQLVKDTETKLNSLDKITGEYQIYEALRSLSGSLTNFKEIVMLSKELNMKKMIQLSEASYIFIKFLQNYRINPVTIETKEIFGYIIYNLKSLVMGKEAEDLDVFISYLNDPVKIYSQKSDKKKS